MSFTEIISKFNSSVTAFCNEIALLTENLNAAIEQMETAIDAVGGVTAKFVILNNRMAYLDKLKSNEVSGDLVEGGSDSAPTDSAPTDSAPGS